MTPSSIRATAAALMLMAVASGAGAQERAFDFALIGDMPRRESIGVPRIVEHVFPS